METEDTQSQSSSSEEMEWGSALDTSLVWHEDIQISDDFGKHVWPHVGTFAIFSARLHTNTRHVWHRILTLWWF